MDNQVNKTFLSRLTRWVDRLLPFEIKVLNAPGHTVVMLDCHSRHLSEKYGNDSKLKAEKLWHNWFTVDGITRKDCSRLANQNWQRTANHPIGANLMVKTKLQTNANVESSEIELVKTNKRTIKQ